MLIRKPLDSNPLEYVMAMLDINTDNAFRHVLDVMQGQISELEMRLKII